MVSEIKSQVYLIHFDRKLHHAGHYVGYTEIGVKNRHKRHLYGNGSKLLYAAFKNGIVTRVVRIWNNVDKSFEKKIKKYKNTPRLCPICSGRKAFKRMRNE